MTTKDSQQTQPASTPQATSPASRKEIFGWCMFDFANSSYTTVIVTVVFGPYFVGAVAREAGLGEDRGDLLWGLAQFLSQGLVLLTAPVLGAICDFSAAKKRFLFISWLGCVVGTAGLYFVHPGEVVLGLLLFILSNIFYSAGENIVAAFLPEIANQKTMGRVSGFGWALGYLGGLGSLAACLPFVSKGMGSEHSADVRTSFLVVAGFFFLGAIPTMLWLKERAHPQSLPPNRSLVATGFSRVAQTLRRVRSYRQLFRFLLVFVTYAAGINVVVAFASIYAERELKMSANEIIIFFIVMQISASLGALLFGFLQDRWSSRLAIQLSLLLWIAVCLGGYFTTSKSLFYAIGNLAGLAMGSAQSGARALVGSFSPVARSGEFFGFWGLFWKLAGAGPLAFGVLRQWVDTRTAILITGVTFVLGFAGMLWIDEEEGKRTALVESEQGGTTTCSIREN